MGKISPPSIVILNYHDVPDHKVDTFTEQIELIKKACSPIRSNFVNIPTGRPYCVAITFDDGYQSVYRNAIPILLNEKIPSTIYVPTAYLGRNPVWDIPVDCPHLNEIVMTEKQIKHVYSELVTIGSHTHSHPKLGELEFNDVRNELVTSKKILEGITGERITELALPHGSYNEEVLTLSKEIGYDKVFYILPIIGKSKNKSILVGRIKAEPDDWPIEFSLKIRGCYNWVTIAVILKARIKKFLSYLRN